MNTSDPRQPGRDAPDAPPPAAATPALAREWALQERAQHQARTHEANGDAGDEARALQAYRRIARALRSEPEGRLPSNFAYEVAQLAARLPRAARLDLRIERWLLRGLVASMAIGALVTTAVYARDWIDAAGRTAGGSAGWIATAAACLLLTWLMEGLPGLLRRDAGATR